MSEVENLDKELIEALLSGASDLQVCRQYGLVPQDIDRAVRRLRDRAGSDATAEVLVAQLRAVRAESARRAAEGRLQALMDISPEAILVVNGTTGTIEMANDLACRMFYYTLEDLVGTSVEDLVPSQYRRVHPAFRINFLGSIRKREMGYHPPIFAARKDGSEIEIAVALTTNPGDDTVMVVCTEFARWSRLTDEVEATAAE